MNEVRPIITRRQQARQFNMAIDQALIDPSTQHKTRVLQLAKENAVEQFAERVRKRATLLGKRHRSDAKRILETRDELILALYASIVPKGWACAWCDGSSIKLHSTQRAGIGGVVMDGSGNVVARISRAIGEKDAFTAELTALASVIDAALEHQQRRLWVYTDNYGLAQLWHEQRTDKRLAEIRKLSGSLERFSLRAIPRQYNQPANALARQAVRNEHSN